MKIIESQALLPSLKQPFQERETVLFLGGFLNSKKYVELSSDCHVAPGPLLLILSAIRSVCANL